MNEKTEVVDIDHVSLLARALVDLRDRVIQKTRIQFGLRLDAMERSADDNIYRAYMRSWHERFMDLEKDLDREITKIGRGIPIVTRMIDVKGISYGLAVQTVAMIDIRRADTVSALWKFAGYGVTDGERDKLEKGKKSPYNKRLKTTCFKVGESFIKSNSPYRHIYDEAKDYYERVHPDWTLGHRHNAARRKMIKIWLSHLWVVWREMEGLPTSDPYILAENEHHRYLSPEEFGWKPL